MMIHHESVTRRRFLEHAWGLLMLGHVVAGGCAAAKGSGWQHAKRVTVPRFAQLKLKTHRVRELEKFYAHTFGLPIVSSSSQSFVMKAGKTLMEFEQVDDGSEPFYHFAFNIPQNKFSLGKEWLGERTPLLRDNESNVDQYFFKTWNAHATYYHDPAGNIGELIARHTLDNSRDGEFSVDDILETSEIGLVARDMDVLARRLCENLELKKYHGSSFAVGDEHGLFIIPNLNRPWIPERTQPATIYPVRATILSAIQRKFHVDGFPYHITCET